MFYLDTSEMQPFTNIQEAKSLACDHEEWQARFPSARQATAIRDSVSIDDKAYLSGAVNIHYQKQ